MKKSCMERNRKKNIQFNHKFEMSLAISLQMLAPHKLYLGGFKNSNHFCVSNGIVNVIVVYFSCCYQYSCNFVSHEGESYLSFWKLNVKNLYLNINCA